MNIKKSDESLVPLKNMKSFLIVHEDEKLVIRKLEKELLEFKKLVDELVKPYPRCKKPGKSNGQGNGEN